MTRCILSACVVFGLIAWACLVVDLLALNVLLAIGG